MPSKLSQPRSACELFQGLDRKARNIQAEQARKRGLIWQARPRAGRQAHRAAVWVPAVLRLKMTGWDSLRGEVPSSSTFSFSFMLESEGQGKHCVLSSQLHSQLAMTFQLLPRAKSCIPFCSWPYLQRTLAGYVQGPGLCEKLERANVGVGVWLPGACGWAARPALGSWGRKLKH